MSEASPPLAGVVGWPVGHSKSPSLHGHWLHRYGIEGFYIPVGLKPQDLAAGMRALAVLGFRGVNVTIPHKEAVLGLAASVSERASLIGAANTVIFDPDGSIRADNTDGYGFLENLRQAAPGWAAAAGPGLVLGAGGASRAIVSALLAEGAPEVRVVNRTRARATMLRDQFGARVVPVDWGDACEAMSGAATIVNATSLGMAGQPALGLRLDSAPAGAVVADIVYRPLATPLLRHARDLGLTAVDGLGMLLHQAAPGFESWFGVRPVVDDALRAAVLAE